MYYYKTMKNKTSWGKVAKWYDKHLDTDDSYHAKVISPNLLRVVDLKAEEALLELGCGQGYFIEKFSSFSKNLTGVDIGKELIDIATKKGSGTFLVGNAEDQQILKGKTFDVITIVLALQNMKNLGDVVKNISRLLKQNGRVILVLNHPAFRIPQKSDWGFDSEKKVQYRRVDSYMSESEITIDMNPGSKNSKEFTKSYHRPMQVYSKAFSKEGFAIAKIEEWISHKESQNGPRKIQEDIARKEIPMFMCLVLKKI